MGLTTRAIVVRPGDSIQEAVDRAPDGAVIRLTRGSWAECIRLHRSLSLCGEGAEQTLIRPNEEGQPAVLVSAAQAGSPLHIRIEGLKVLSVYGDWYGYGIFVERQAHVWISNAIVGNARKVDQGTGRLLGHLSRCSVPPGTPPRLDGRFV